MLMTLLEFTQIIMGRLRAVTSLRYLSHVVIMKLSRKGDGAPGREPVMNEEQRKEWMMQSYRRQEELKKLDVDDDDKYLDASWADGQNLKRSCQGLNNINWRPFKS